MAIEVKKRSEIEEQYKWDLTTLYPSDEAWEADFKTLDAEFEVIRSYQGTLKDAPSIRKWFDYSITLDRKVDRLFCYAMQREDEDGRCSDAQVMIGKIYGKAVALGGECSFGDPEILSLPEEELKALLDAPELEPYRVGMKRLLREKPHTLSAAEEKILASAGEVLGAAGDISAKLMDVDMTFDTVKDGEGKEVPVTEAGYISLQQSPDRVLRENSFRSFYKSYAGHINTLGATYATSVKSDIFKAKTRHYPSARAMSVAGENVPEYVYDMLVERVHAHMPTMHRYAALRKEMLGVDELHYYDLYTSLVKDVETNYSYEEAQQLVLNAVKPLGEDYAKVVRRAFAERWLDVYPNEGKRGGAYSGGCYDSNPFILLNFSGSLDSVSTIAHEMGHSLHSYLSRKHQPPQNANYTLFVAEVASTVNENLLVEQLLQADLTDELRLSLLNQYLENFKGTVYRQTMFAEFEKKAHEQQESGEPLSAEGLCDIYGQLVKDYFGEALVWDKEVRYEWARIPHFYNCFYVYKYATSYCAATAISEGILRDGQSAVDSYLKFLSLGGSLPPLDELKVAGVDMSVPDAIDRALDKFDTILTETENLYRKMKAEGKL